jgi:hypothetical protein
VASNSYECGFSQIAHSACQRGGIAGFVCVLHALRISRIGGTRAGEGGHCDARVKHGRTPFQEAKRLGNSPCDLNEIELGRRSEREVLDEVHSSDAKKGNTRITIARLMWICGERRDGRWVVIVIPPAGDREDVRVVQADLEFMQAIEIVRRLRKPVREFPQAETYSADELSALCTRLCETIKLHERI